jgi:hypothetical protein
VISGNPKFLTWNVEEADGGLYAGIWEATPGKWRIVYDEWEFCHILTGVSIITEDGGEARTVRAGDSDPSPLRGGCRAKRGGWGCCGSAGRLSHRRISALSGSCIWPVSVSARRMRRALPM